MRAAEKSQETLDLGPAARLKIACVTMQFPAPAETFASSDLRALCSQVKMLQVFCLRGAHSRSAEFVRSRQLDKIKIYNPKGFGDFFSIVRQPIKFLFLCFYLLRYSPQNFSSFAKSFYFIPRALKIFSQIKREGFDVVHLFWGHYPALVGCLVSKFLKGTKVSCFLGAYDLAMELPYSVKLAKNSDLLWTHASVNLSHFEKLGIPSSKVQVLHRGVDVTTCEIQGESKNPLQITTGGRLIEDKNFQSVIGAFSRIRKRWPDARLLVFGEGPYRPVLEQQIKDLGLQQFVTLTGHLGHDQVMKALAKSDFFVFLSQYQSERLPNIVKEAMLNGCICLVSKTPGIEELVENQEDGIILEGNNFENEIIYEMSLCLENKDRAIKISKAAREKIRERFNTEIQIREMLSSFSKL